MRGIPVPSSATTKRRGSNEGGGRRHVKRRSKRGVKHNGCPPRSNEGVRWHGQGMERLRLPLWTIEVNRFGFQSGTMASPPHGNTLGNDQMHLNWFLRNGSTNQETKFDDPSARIARHDASPSHAQPRHHPPWARWFEPAASSNFPGSFPF